MQTWLSPGWSDYKLLDSGNGQRLEQFGAYVLVRPDARAMWPPTLPTTTWQQADATFVGQENSKGEWRQRRPLPEKWLIEWQQLKMWLKLTPFKHTGLFPEQSVQWQLLQDVIKTANRPVDRPVKMLNLFAYTGAATLAAAAVGAEVVTVDASKPAMNWFRDNQTESQLLDKPVRLILEDVLKFASREVKRGSKYDIIMMDPPAFGNGPKGEKWQFSRQFPELIQLTSQLVSDQPLLLLINTYTDSATEQLIQQGIQKLSGGRLGTIEVGQLALQEGTQGRTLPTGSYAWWQST